MLSFKFNLNNVTIILITILITFWIGYLSYKAFEDPQTQITPTPTTQQESQTFDNEYPLLNHDTPLAKRDIRLYEKTRGDYYIQFINENEVKLSEPFGANTTTEFSSAFYTIENIDYGLAIKLAEGLPELIGYNFSKDEPLEFAEKDSQKVKQFAKSVLDKSESPVVYIIQGTSKDSIYLLTKGYFAPLSLDHYPLYKISINNNEISIEKEIDFGKAYDITLPDQYSQLKNLPTDINAADYFVVSRGKYTRYEAEYKVDAETPVNDESWDELVKVTANGNVIKIRNLTDAERKYSED